MEQRLKSFSLGLLLLGFTLLLAATLACAQAGGPSKPTSLAEESSGMYTFLHEGEFVQINLEDDSRLSGFVSRYSDSDKNSFLDHFFEKGEFQHGHIHFLTRKVHGVWFDFKGTLARGPAKTRKEEGYYVMKGVLTEYTSDAAEKVGAKEREVTFRSFPQYEDEDEPPRK
jgi:hypothetical protein